MVWKISSVVLLGPLMTNLDSTAVNVSLSSLSTELHAPLSQIQWVTSGYLLALALMLPLSGWLVNRVGTKRVYILCFSLFTIASLLCGLATSAGVLIAFRILQGMVGGLIAPMAQMMIARIAGPHMARVMGFAAVPVLIGPVFGPVLAGAILQHANWRWIFFINLPIGLLATALTIYVLPKDDDQVQPQTFDLAGFLLLSPSLVLLLHSLDSLSSNSAAKFFSIAELMIAITLVLLFVWHGKRWGGAALIDINLFRRRAFSTAAIIQFLSNAMLLGGQLLVPLYLLLVLHQSPSSTGLLLVPAGLGSLLYPIMGYLMERFGARLVAVWGAGLALLGTLPFVLFKDSNLPVALLCASLFVRGVGLGAVNIPSFTVAYSAIPQSMIPAATTSLNIVQRVGGPVATTLLAIYLHHSMQIHVADPPKAFIATFWLLCIIHIAGIVAVVRLPNREQQHPTTNSRKI
ncbi:MAG: DHA2 family efflux MFS transporter permease subunit [Nostoc sp.]